MSTLTLGGGTANVNACQLEGGRGEKRGQFWWNCKFIYKLVSTNFQFYTQNQEDFTKRVLSNLKNAKSQGHWKKADFGIFWKKDWFFDKLTF